MYEKPRKEKEKENWMRRKANNTHTNTIRESRLPVDAVRMRCGAGGWGVVDG